MHSITHVGYLHTLVHKCTLAYPIPPAPPCTHAPTPTSRSRNRRPATIALDDTYTTLEETLEDHPDIEVLPLVDGRQTRVLVGAVRRTFLETVLAAQQAIAYRAPPPNDDILESRTGMQSLLLTSPDQSPEHGLERGEEEPAASQPQGTDASSSLNVLPVDDVLLDKEDDMPRPRDMMHEPVDFTHCHIDSTPLRVIEQTPLSQIHTMFSLLQIDVMYVTTVGRLVGTITLTELSRAILEDDETTFQVSALQPHPSMGSTSQQRSANFDSTTSRTRSRAPAPSLDPSEGDTSL